MDKSEKLLFCAMISFALMALILSINSQHLRGEVEQLRVENEILEWNNEHAESMMQVYRKQIEVLERLREAESR